jgi:hypothetical protein
MLHIRLFNRFILMSLALIFSSASNASLIDRIDFDTGAIDYGFDGVALGEEATVIDGILSVSNGVTSKVAVGDLFSPSYSDGGNGSEIRFDFSSLVSAVGVDFFANPADTTLSIFGATANLLESFTVPTGDMFVCTPGLCGFVGIDFGSDLISYAIIDTSLTLPQPGIEIYVDNIIYQSGVSAGPPSAVPVPAAVWLFGTALIGLVGFGKRKARIAT